MKKVPLVFLTTIIIISACNKKAVPVITARKVEPAPVKPVSNVKPNTELGKMIFTNRCGRCHDLPRPEQYTAQRWDGILSSMIPRSRLNDEQAVHITAYLKANAKQ